MRRRGSPLSPLQGCFSKVRIWTRPNVGEAETLEVIKPDAITHQCELEERRANVEDAATDGQTFESSRKAKSPDDFALRLRVAMLASSTPSRYEPSSSTFPSGSASFTVFDSSPRKSNCGVAAFTSTFVQSIGGVAVWIGTPHRRTRFATYAHTSETKTIPKMPPLGVSKQQVHVGFEIPSQVLAVVFRHKRREVTFRALCDSRRFREPGTEAVVSRRTEVDSDFLQRDS